MKLDRNQEHIERTKASMRRGQRLANEAKKAKKGVIDSYLPKKPYDPERAKPWEM